VTSVAHNERVQAAVVALPEGQPCPLPLLSVNPVPHITLSTAKGAAPRESNDLLRDTLSTVPMPTDPVEVWVQLGFHRFARRSVRAPAAAAGGAATGGAPADTPGASGGDAGVSVSSSGGGSPVAGSGPVVFPAAVGSVPEAPALAAPGGGVSRAADTAPRGSSSGGKVLDFTAECSDSD
jgi:hypothetical protein